LPLCFASFQFLKENLRSIKNQQLYNWDIEDEEKKQIIDENSLPFTSFEFLKEHFGNTTEAEGDKPVKDFTISSETIHNDLQKLL
jgi:hypothetical protein